jgi:Fur family transcriptional regulator, ferric uptake regulator
MPTSALLKSFQLRQTDCREEVLSVFLANSFALAHGDIEHKLADKFDRVTVYRTLKTFLEKGLLHKVLDDEGGTKYALCKESCHTEAHKHHHDHVHFKCNQCGQTTCLDHIHIPVIGLPQGFKRQEINILVQGVCDKCS